MTALRRFTRALLFASACAWAASAQTLPQGRGRISVGVFWVHQDLPGYDLPHLLDEDQARTLVSSLLDKGVISALGDMSGRNLSLLTPGASFSGAADALVTVPQLDFGVTDHLTATVIWPYFSMARARVKLAVSHSLLAYNGNYDPRKPTNADNFPIAYDNTSRPVTGTPGLQALLTNVFGYRPLESWQSYGTGDPVLAMTYGFGAPPRSLLATALVQLPLGKIADADNLVQIPFGAGHVKAGARLFYEDLEGRPFVFTAGLSWLAHFRDRPTLRIYGFAPIPISTSDAKERVSRVQGQQLGATVGMGRLFLDGLLRPQLTVGYDHAFQDTIRGSRPAKEYAALISNTGATTYSAELSLLLSTVDRFLAGSFAVPFQVALSFRGQAVDRGLFNGIPQFQSALTTSTFF